MTAVSTQKDSVVYLWLDKIIILEMTLLVNFIKFFFHQSTEIICATAEIHYLQVQQNSRYQGMMQIQ